MSSLMFVATGSLILPAAFQAALPYNPEEPPSFFSSYISSTSSSNSKPTPTYTTKYPMTQEKTNPPSLALGSQAQLYS
jgi:hypothetical protein